MHYQSSKLFGALKATEETIKDNYSSGQLIDVMDQLILHALRPILESSNWMNSYMGNIIGWYSNNNKRKISKVGKPKLLTLMTTFLFLPTVEEKLECISLMRLERSFLFSALADWTKMAQGYASAYVRYEASGRQLIAEEKRLQVYSQQLGLQPSSRDHYGAVLDCLFWEKQATAFKSQIMEKYYRSMIMEAKNVYVSTDHRISLDDLIQDMTIITSKAIDKYDATKGTLTTYIEWWWKAVKNSTLEDLVKESALSLDEHASTLANQASDVSVEEELIKKEDNSRLQELACAVDPIGLGRIFLGIYES